ncbi:hypothetical protein EDB83DRAFT_2391399 [Lactarius deliciosus]|nr:hypothetical protein EDB83DRAFT_2391399 [Lactarius deliciosus]
MLVPFARQTMQHACTPSSTHLFGPVSVVRRRRDAYRSASLRSACRTRAPHSPFLFQCATSDDEALTRVVLSSLTRERLYSTVYYQPVKPQNPITSNLQKHLRSPISPSTILLGHSLESDLLALSYILRSFTSHAVDRSNRNRPGVHKPKEDARACIDPLKSQANIKSGRGLGEFRANYEPDPCAHRGSNGICTRTALLSLTTATSVPGTFRRRLRPPRLSPA